MRKVCVSMFRLCALVEFNFLKLIFAMLNEAANVLGVGWPSHFIMNRNDGFVCVCLSARSFRSFGKQSSERSNGLSRSRETTKWYVSFFIRLLANRSASVIEMVAN